jgi:hypothetical protein
MYDNAIRITVGYVAAAPHITYDCTIAYQSNVTHVDLPVIFLSPCECDGNVGEITQALKDAYFNAARGNSEDHSHWVTPVY